MDQSILTTHSPFVLEQYDPADVVLLERRNDGVVAGRRIEAAGIKAKAYKRNLRRVLAEAMLGNGVLCVEGVSDGEALYTASAVLEECSQEGAYTPLDLSGVTVVQCEGDGGLLRYGRFFSAIGLRTYAVFDRQKSEAIVDEIVDVFDAAWELEQTGIERLLAEETSIDVIHDFLSDASEWDDYPHNSMKPELFEYDPDSSDDHIRSLCGRVLKVRKGSGYAQRLVEFCSVGDLPAAIIAALEHISEDLPNELSNACGRSSRCSFSVSPTPRFGGSWRAAGASSRTRSRGRLRSRPTTRSPGTSLGPMAICCRRNGTSRLSERTIPQSSALVWRMRTGAGKKSVCSWRTDA